MPPATASSRSPARIDWSTRPTVRIPEAQTRVIPVFEEETLDDGELQELVDSGEAKGGLRKLAVTHERPDGRTRRVILVGAGKRAEFDPERARLAAAAATARARELGGR